MIMIGKYKYSMEINNLVFSLQCLQELVKIFIEHSMKYNINLEFKMGDSIYDLSIEDLINDSAIDKKRIKGVIVRATNEDIEIDLKIGKDVFEEIKIEGNSKEEFKQLKQEIQDWVYLFKNHNPFMFLAPLSAKSEIIRVLISIGLSIFTLIPMIIEAYLNNSSVKILDGITILTFFTACYYFLLLLLSWVFIRRVEIDIGINNYKTRRKIGSWVLSVVIIPVVISWIFCLV